MLIGVFSSITFPAPVVSASHCKKKQVGCFHWKNSPGNWSQFLSLLLIWKISWFLRKMLALSLREISLLSSPVPKTYQLPECTEKVHLAEQLWRILGLPLLLCQSEEQETISKQNKGGVTPLPVEMMLSGQTAGTSAPPLLFPGSYVRLLGASSSLPLCGSWLLSSLTG